MPTPGEWILNRCFIKDLALHRKSEGLAMLPQSHCPWWLHTAEASSRLAARELAILLWNGNPQQAGTATDWKRLG
jgi:hypothetical protein